MNTASTYTKPQAQTSTDFTAYQKIYTDSHFLMNPTANVLLQKLRKQGFSNILDVRPSAWQQLKKLFSSGNGQALQGRALVENFRELFQSPLSSETNEQPTEQDDLIQVLNTQPGTLIITADRYTLNQLQHRNPQESDSTVMMLNERGQLESSAALAREASRAKLRELLKNRVFLHSSSFKRAEFDLFIKNAMEETDERPVFTAISSYAPEDVCKRYQDAIMCVDVPSESEANALAAEIFFSFDLSGGNCIVVLDDEETARYLLEQRRACGISINLMLFIINKYGYLSLLNLTSPDRKPTAFIPQLIHAIRQGDVDAICNLLEMGAPIRNAIITALCQNRDDVLNIIMDKVEDLSPLPSSIIRWWICDFSEMKCQDYPQRLPQHFDCLNKVVDCTELLTEEITMMTGLCRRLAEWQQQGEVHPSWWDLINQLRRKGAPVPSDLPTAFIQKIGKAPALAIPGNCPQGPMSVAELAEATNSKPFTIIARLLPKGIFANPSTILDQSLINYICGKYHSSSAE